MLTISRPRQRGEGLYVRIPSTETGQVRAGRARCSSAAESPRDVSITDFSACGTGVARSFAAAVHFLGVARAGSGSGEERGATMDLCHFPSFSVAIVVVFSSHRRHI